MVNITSHHITSHHITSHHITSHHITSHHITSHHITSHHITSHHITSHHITSHHITSHHITSHHIKSHTRREKYQHMGQTEGKSPISNRQCDTNEVVLARTHQPPQGRPKYIACHHVETIRQENTTMETS